MLRKPGPFGDITPPHHLKERDRYMKKSNKQLIVTAMVTGLVGAGLSLSAPSLAQADHHEEGKAKKAKGKKGKKKGHAKKGENACKGANGCGGANGCAGEKKAEEGAADAPKTEEAPKTE
jgi:uncharacterized membrane protein